MTLAHAAIADYSGVAMPAESAQVERRTRLDPAEFRDEYLLPRRPVVLTDAAAAWPIYHRGTPEYFRRRYGDRGVKLFGQTCRLGELLEVLEIATNAKPGPYPCKFEIAREFPELLAEVMPRPALSVPDRLRSALLPQALFEGVNNLEIFFGGEGGRFPYLHYDVLHLHAWNTQLHGNKEFTLYAPGQEALLYVNPDLPWQSLIRNHQRPDFSRYPLFRHARAQAIVVHPGDPLFVPCGWWHTARSLDFTISVAFDQLGADNWSDFVDDVVTQRQRDGKHARAMYWNGYLRAIEPLLRVIEVFGGNRAASWGGR
jgi:hypothetical protein